MTRASASFSVRPVALTWYSMAVASHWPVSSWATSTSNFMLVSVALRKCRVAGRCVGLGPRDFGRDPERAVHPLTDHQVPALVDDRDGHVEAERVGLGDAPLDALARVLQRQGHSTKTSSASMRTG